VVVVAVVAENCVKEVALSARLLNVHILSKPWSLFDLCLFIFTICGV